MNFEAQLATVCVVGTAGGLLGWSLVVITSRIERERRVQQPELSGSFRSAESITPSERRPWLRRWLRRRLVAMAQAAHGSRIADRPSRDADWNDAPRAS